MSDANHSIHPVLALDQLILPVAVRRCFHHGVAEPRFRGRDLSLVDRPVSRGMERLCLLRPLLASLLVPEKVIVPVN